MQLEERIQALIELGHRLNKADEYREAVIHRTHFNNQWFTKENQRQAINAIAEEFLAEKKLRNWLRNYSIPRQTNAQSVALILAGNIPLVGFHDVLCVFVSGHQAQIKLSDKDRFLLPYILRELKQIDPRTETYFSIVERLQDFTTVIATGSNNSSRYFESYFSTYAHIIRRNRNAVAVLSGSETREQLSAFGEDIFQYYGLGCRNVSKIYVPKDYDFTPLLEALHEHKEIVLNDKYKNNFDYNYAILVLNKVKYMANGCIILKEHSAIASHIAGLHYEYYEDHNLVEKEISNRLEEIQLVVAQPGLLSIPTFSFGAAQRPGLGDYADGVDTLAFLLAL
jgi:hypothetical protein